MRARLLAVGGTAKPIEIALVLPTIIGRGHAASLKLPHPLISRKHCELFEQDGELMVRDLGSLNGTFVGSQRVAEAVVPSGELLTVGTITFRAVYDTEVDSDATAPAPASRSSKATHSTDFGIDMSEDRTEREFPIDEFHDAAGPVDRQTALPPDRSSHDSNDGGGASTFFEEAD